MSYLYDEYSYVIRAMPYNEYSYVILLVYLCCTIGARLLHYRCKAAALTVLGCFLVTIRQKKQLT